MPRRSRGFTLVEVLVAFTILAMILGATLQVLSDGMRAVRVGQAHTRAVLVAQSHLDLLSATPDLEEGVTDGTEPGAPGADGTFHWEATVTPYPGDDLGDVDTGPLRLWWAVVRVSWVEDERERSVDLGTLLLGSGS